MVVPACLCLALLLHTAPVEYCFIDKGTTFCAVASLMGVLEQAQDAFVMRCYAILFLRVTFR